jgi:hypothetical protein
MEVERARRFGQTVFRGAETVDIREYLKSGLEKPGSKVVPFRCDSLKAARSWRFVVEAKADAGRVHVLGWIPSVGKAYSIENRLERLEEQFNSLVSSTWDYLFSERDVKEMRELSKGILEDSKKMQELAQQLQEADDES